MTGRGSQTHTDMRPYVTPRSLTDPVSQRILQVQICCFWANKVKDFTCPRNEGV